MNLKNIKFTGIKKKLKALAIFSGIFLLAIFLINWRVDSVGKKYIYSDNKEIHDVQAALVLGASVYGDGRLSDMLKDRADTAFDLYWSGKVEKILVSADNGTMEYNEAGAIKKYLLLRGVLEEDLFLDYAGFDTYDSLYRAKNIFGAKSLIITTQNFHLPRALYIGRSLGMEVYGLSADAHVYGGIEKNYLREIPAKTKAFLDVNFYSKPRFMGEAISLDGDGRKSWD